MLLDTEDGKGAAAVAVSGERPRNTAKRSTRRSFSALAGRATIRRGPGQDIRRFQLHQHESGVGPATINGAVSALRFLFLVTLKRRDLARVLVIMRHPRKLPDVLSVEEAARLLEAAPGIKYKAALGVAYGAGLRVSEVAHLKVDDIDSTRMLIRVEQGKGRKDRNAMLSPQLLELLRLWWREGRRRGVMLPHGWLFPGRSCTDPISSRQLHRAVQEAAEVAGIRKRVSPHTLLLRHPPARAGCRHTRHPGAARALQARNDSALHQGLDPDDPRGRRVARPADGSHGRQNAVRLNRCAPTWRSPISSVLPAPDTGSPTPGV
ncbi:tyrosine-type recombinase/integrase [Mesorhizobium sp. LNJC399B00]|uniref:tyrosine-type recombinase/integrase n=1 Tax=Mesorhizobium sp. LNJC399B00 TaxID=1287277 RepID=UPI000414C007